MTDEKDTDVTENYSDQSAPTPQTRVLGDPKEMVEKGEDFSSEASVVEETPQVAETPEELKQKLNDVEDKMLRIAAEYDNYRKRTARQQDELIKSANDRLFSELIDVIDNFERALQHAKEDSAAGAILAGTEMIYNQLLALLAKNGVTPIDAIGKPFDPQLHEAMLQVSSDSYSEGIVATELAKGYQQGTRVIRHSKVGVSRGKA